MNINPLAKYTNEELEEYRNIGCKSGENKRPNRPFFKKSALEYGPTWRDKREFVHKIIYDINMEPAAKGMLKEHYDIISHFQFRGFKYGVITSAGVFFFMPVIRRQLFVRRLLLSSIPFLWFMKWGYTWGHEKWWRKTYPVVASFEIGSGLRSKFTGK